MAANTDEDIAGIVPYVTLYSPHDDVIACSRIEPTASTRLQ
jgi:hypothetical protein